MKLRAIVPALAAGILVIPAMASAQVLQVMPLFEARCAQVLTHAATRCSVAFMAGNRDFLVGAGMLAACGVIGRRDLAAIERGMELVAELQAVLGRGEQAQLEQHDQTI